jgi:hypothetical protein
MAAVYSQYATASDWGMINQGRWILIANSARGYPFFIGPRLDEPWGSGSVYLRVEDAGFDAARSLYLDEDAVQARLWEAIGK